MNRKLIESKVLEVLHFAAETRGPLTAREVSRLATSALLQDEGVVKRALLRLARAGKVRREVRRRFVGVHSHAFPRGGASVVRREALFSEVR